MLLHIQHICPGLVPGVVGEDGPEEIRIQPHLDEPLSGEPANGCRGDLMLATYPHLLKLLDDMTVELLVPGKMDYALDEFLLNLLPVIRRL